MRHTLIDIIKKGLLLTAVLVLMAGFVRAEADDSVSIREINYDNSTITIQLSAADRALYISDNNQKKWEYVPIAKNASNRIVLDISWISATKDYILSLKGDASDEPIKVKIPKMANTLKVTYNMYTNTINCTGIPAGRDVQWKKKESMSWISGEPAAEQLSGLCVNGASLMFRLAPENGTDEDDPGYRPGKEVALAIPKKTPAPTIKVNDSFMTIPVVKGLRYRYCDKYGNPNGTGIDTPVGADTDGWATIDFNGNMLLTEIAPKSMIATNPSTEDTYIQFYTKASSSKQMSAITTIKIPAQEDLPGDADTKIEIVYTSSTTFELRVPYASAEKPYEYCILNQNDIEDGVEIDDYEDIKWKDVNSTAGVAVNRDNDHIEDGSLIYVRRKAYHTLGETDYKLASPIIEVAEVAYPGTISTDSAGVLWLQTIAGTCRKDNTSGFISFSVYSPTNNVVKEIKFVGADSKDLYGTLTRANGDFKSTVSRNTDPGDTDPDRAYIITTTLMSTAALDSKAENPDTRSMLAYITLEDSTEAFESTSATGVGLYIYPGTEVNNPSGASERSDKEMIASKLGWSSYNVDKDMVDYSTAFTRIIGSNRVYDAGDTTRDSRGEFDPTSFRVRLDIGTRYVPNMASSEPGVLKTGDANKVTVEKIKYDGAFFTATPAAGATKAAYTVEYADMTNEKSEPTRMAVITINADVIEQSTTVDDRNTNTPIYIYLSNGEILSSAVTMNLRETAILDGGSSSWSIVEGSLQEYDVTTTTNAGVTETTKTPHYDRTVTLTAFDSSYNVSLTSVTWNGYTVASQISKTGATITFKLSNIEINKIDVARTTSACLVFTFDNGFTITSGWNLTINPTND